MWTFRQVAGGLASVALLAGFGAFVLAQPPAISPQPAPSRPAGGAAAGGDLRPAIIERTPLVLIPAADFRIPLHLEPGSSVIVSARTDGVVASVLIKLGDAVQSQSEVMRLNSDVAQLELQRAQAAVKAAQADIKAADGAAREAAEAHADVARFDLDIAQLRLDDCNLKTPISGRVIRIHASEGEYVRAGDPLVTIADERTLRVELPVDARATVAGGAAQFLVEDVAATGQVEAVVPLAERFEPLRDLFLSVGSAVVTIDNAAGKFRAGQTVYSTLIPRQPVTEAPVSALQNAEGGERKVQVLRDHFVRDVPVQLLGQVGSDYIFVSGRFGPNDELILRSSETLLDGARVAPQSSATDGAGEGGSRPATPTGSPTRGANF